MTEPNETWSWLEQAAQEAREIIERLYAEGRSGLADRFDTAPAPAHAAWPAHRPDPSKTP